MQQPILNLFCLILLVTRGLLSVAIAQQPPSGTSSHSSLQPEDRPSQSPVPAEQVGPTEVIGLMGHVVVGPEGRELGRVADMLSDRQGRIKAVVLDVGGFMGVGNRKVALAWSAVRFTARDKELVIATVIPPDRIKSWADYIPGRPVAILGTSEGGR